MAIAKKAVLTIFLVAVAFVGCGYATAWARLEQCRLVTVNNVLQSKVTGLGFGGDTIVLTERDVGARIRGPFQVETYYSVPTGMHSSEHLQLFTTFPWAIKPGAQQTFHTV